MGNCANYAQHVIPALKKLAKVLPNFSKKVEAMVGNIKNRVKEGEDALKFGEEQLGCFLP